jgi:creatinine amidohydrolase
MQWENLTTPEFKKAVKASRGVCVVPCGVIEKHGDHLPLGTDVAAARAIALEAARLEPVLVFPYFCYGQIAEAKPHAGTISVRTALVLELLENVCEEIARNGLRKVVLLNGHGGNEGLFRHFVRSMLERKRDYLLYCFGLSSYMSPVLDSPEWKAMAQSAFDHHAGEGETSVMLALSPELVKMGSVPKNARAGSPRRRLAHLPGVDTALNWYADHPEHYAGDARTAASAKGEFLLKMYAERVAALLRAVKDDTVLPALHAEFFAGVSH